MPETAAGGRRSADRGRQAVLAPAELRARRRALGLTQAGLAAALDVSANTVARWERGELRAGHPGRVLRRLERLEQRRPGTAPAGPARAARPRPAGPRSARSDAARPGLLEEPPQGLPGDLSSFIGRELELRDVRRRLGTARLLTLVGTGGVGKTRLALALLRGPRADRRGAGAFVDLAALADPDLVPQTVAAQLGVREQPGRPVLATLVDALRRAPLLMILDNCEHLVGACARLADTLLRSCPELRILATSREPLDVAGEVVWRVPSLSLPEAPPRSEQVEDTEAVRLFVERARAALPAFALTEQNARAVADVCRRLDGIPLALELAAAHVPLLSVGQIAERLDDALGLLTRGSRLAPARQQTVRATLDWSYGLLTPPERRLFARLAVFAGGWTLEAAEAVAGTDGLAPRAVLPVLGRLVDQSLVVVEPAPGGPARYRLLEALRQYGLERLAAGGRAPRVRDRHAAYFLALAEQAAPELFGPGAPAAQARLERERDNCRAALRWLVERAATERAQRLVGALGRFWFYRGYLAEGEAWTARVLAMPGAERPTAGRAKALYAAGAAALGRGDYTAVETAAREARALWRALGDAAEEGWSLFLLGFVARLRGDYPAARAFLETGLAASRAAGHGAAEANCLWALAEVAADQGDDREARSLAEAALARATAVGWTVGRTVARRVLGTLHLRRGDYPAAEALLSASLADTRRQEARWWTAETLVRLGQLALAQGELGAARAHLAESLALARDLGDRTGAVSALEGLAHLAVVQGAPRYALQLAGAAAAQREAGRAPLAPSDRARLERHLVPARRALGARAAEGAWAEGRALPLRPAIDLALAGPPAGPQERAGTRRPTVLTPREHEVAGLVARGLTNRQIAAQLVIAEGTAERHVGNILAKLDVATRSQIAAWVAGQGGVRAEPGG